MIPFWQALREDKEKREKFFLRAQIISLIRDFFVREGFLEVETPSVVKFPGMEPNLNPARVNFSLAGEEETAYLVTSPEYAMKKLLAAGFTKIFQICKSFRGGDQTDKLHNFEFTMIEWYRAGADYGDIMSDVERLISGIAKDLRGKSNNKEKLEFEYQGRKIDLAPPWERLSVREAFQRYTGLELDALLDRERIRDAALKIGYNVNEGDSFDDIFFKIFLSKIEPELGRGKPTILYDWPARMAALSRLKPGDERYAERFEVYIAGLELGNAFSELVDPAEQRKRLTEEQEERARAGKEFYGIDDGFINALKNVPPSGGIAMGVDRIVMFFADAPDIKEVVFFPANEIFNQ